MTLPPLVFLAYCVLKRFNRLTLDKMVRDVFVFRRFGVASLIIAKPGVETSSGDQ